MMFISTVAIKNVYICTFAKIKYLGCIHPESFIKWTPLVDNKIQVLLYPDLTFLKHFQFSISRSILVSTAPARFLRQEWRTRSGAARSTRFRDLVAAQGEGRARTSRGALRGLDTPGERPRSGNWWGDVKMLTALTGTEQGSASALFFLTCS